MDKSSEIYNYDDQYENINTTSKKDKIENSKTNLDMKDSSNFSSIINEKIITEDNHKNFSEENNPKTIIQKFNKQIRINSIYHRDKKIR